MLTAHLELGFLECQLSELLASAKEEERLQIDECLNRIKKTFFLPQDKHIFKKFLSVRAQQP